MKHTFSISIKKRKKKTVKTVKETYFNYPKRNFCKSPSSMESVEEKRAESKQ